MADGEREEGKDRWRERERSVLSAVKREGENRERSPHSKDRKDNRAPKQRNTKTKTRKREPQRPRTVKNHSGLTNKDLILTVGGSGVQQMQSN